MKNFGKVICSIEDWDTVLNYYRPNCSSRTWYLEELGNLQPPMMWGDWNIREERTGKVLPRHFIESQVTPDYGEKIQYLTKQEIGSRNHLYVVPIFDPAFFIKNRQVGLQCISPRYLADFRENRAKLVFTLPTEGYSGTKGNIDFNIIQEWIESYSIPGKNVFYFTGNLVGDVVAKENGFTFNVIPLHTFENWITHSTNTLPEFYIKFNPEKSAENYLFLSYNRAPRTHRLLFGTLLKKEGLLSKGRISLGDLKNSHLGSTGTPDLIPIFEELKIDTPLLIDRDIFFNLANDVTVKDYEKTFISVVTETLTDPGTLFFSEKIWKPISLGHPFIVLGSKNSLQHLRDLGYQTFNEWIDESYDNEPDLYKRTVLIVEELKKLSKKSISELTEMRKNMHEICTHNRKHFFKEVNRKYSLGRSGPVVETLIKIYENEF